MSVYVFILCDDLWVFFSPCQKLENTQQHKEKLRGNHAFHRSFSRFEREREQSALFFGRTQKVPELLFCPTQKRRSPKSEKEGKSVF